ncbi:YopX family protein [Lysinibacillus sp. NPDC096418]|uniref:YopX family protein n=1 Tax=Lysinibacillus sp. NPDC096418 TaxID=3364138 RepID=UPI0037FB3B40
MREIKFRAWEILSLEMGMMRPVRCINFGREVVDFDGVSTNYLKNTKLMQYTGLKDKNGKEIYEGDIIRFTNGIDEVYEEVGTVIFDLEECGYKAQYIDDGVTRCIYLINPKVFADKYTEITYEIIGNIYENPELLGDSQ